MWGRNVIVVGSIEHQVAVVGMSCRYPGAPSLEAFWELITLGREGLTWLDEARLRAARVPSRMIAHPDYVPVPTLLLRASLLSPRNSGEGMGVDDIEDADLGWGPWIHGPLRTCEFEAHHYSILQAPAVSQVAREVLDFLHESAASPRQGWFERTRSPQGKERKSG